jgi:hypothetical protein
LNTLPLSQGRKRHGWSDSPELKVCRLFVVISHHGVIVACF